MKDFHEIVLKAIACLPPALLFCAGMASGLPFRFALATAIALLVLGSCLQGYVYWLLQEFYFARGIMHGRMYDADRKRSMTEYGQK